MILISLRNENEIKKAKKVLSELNIPSKIIDENNNQYDEKSQKTRVIICDLDFDKIKELSTSNTILIVYKNPRQVLTVEERKLFYEENIYSYSSIKDLREILNLTYRKENFNNKLKKILVLILTIIAVIASFIAAELFLKEKQKPVIKEKIIAQKQDNVDYTRENIVFIGDSITEFYNMDTFYGDLPVINSGKSGNKTDDIYGGLEEKVYVYNPTKVILMIGTNDLSYRSNEYIVNRIKQSIKEINKNRKHAKVYLESIYPVNNKTDNDVVIDWMVGTRENSRIMEINKSLKSLCVDKVVKCEYINMYDELTDEEGNLKLDYTIDGLHISPEGYEVITKKLMTYIEKVEQ